MKQTKSFVQIVLFTVLLFHSPVYALEGGFQAPVSLSASVSPRGVAVGSVYGMGIQDFIVANFGSPTFIGQSTPTSILNASKSSLQIFSPSPTGLQLRDTIPTASSPRGVFLFDANGQNRQDIFVTAYDANLLQVFGRSGGKFSKIAEAPTLKLPVGVTVGFTRPGGLAFVAVADYGSNSISLYPLKGHQLGTRIDIPVDEGPTQIAIGDLDGDGVNEIAVVCLLSNKIDILSLGPGGKGDLSLSYSVTKTISLPDGGAPADVKIVDLNQDGLADLVTADFSKNTVNIFYQQKNGSLQAQPVLSTSGSHPNGLTVADLYGTGNKEIIVANRDSDSIDLFQPTQGQYQLTRTLKLSQDSNSAFGPVEVGVLDTRGTGQKDLVVSHMRSNSIMVVAQEVSATPTPTAGIGSSGTGRAEFSEDTTYCYPNPARNSNVTFSFQLAQPSSVLIQIFDLQGEKVWSQSLAGGQTQSGVNTIAWQGTNLGGQNLASGLYIYTVTAGNQTVTKKIAIIH